jgi:putative RNA 2'-phosphotransferase
MNKTIERKRKELSYILRHNPKGLNMDKNGYVLVTDLLKKLDISLQDLECIVSENDKKRFSFDSSKEKLRASQGHSIKVDVQLKATRPPRILYHGTSPNSYEKIIHSKGLDKMNRLHVHLTDSIDIAKSVGKRYSKRNKPVVLEINSAAMNTDGFKFFLSENGVWLTDNVPLKYIKINDLW